MATEKVGVYRKYHGAVPNEKSGTPLAKSEWPRARPFSWAVRWFGSDGKRFSKSFKNRREARGEKGTFYFFFSNREHSFEPPVNKSRMSPFLLSFCSFLLLDTPRRAYGGALPSSSWRYRLASAVRPDDSYCATRSSMTPWACVD